MLDLVAGLLFEAGFLALFFRMLLRLHRDLAAIDATHELPGMLRWTIVLQLVVAAPNLLSSGFGVFSDGSRIDYLSAGSLPKYFTYAGLLISMAQASMIAAWISGRGKLGSLGWTAIGVAFALSILAGSKGGVFLWLLAIASLVDYRRARIPLHKIFLVVLVVIMGALLSSLVVAEFFGLELSEFMDLAVSRFFLTNDARALALDLRSSRSAEIAFFSESFRSLGNLFGAAPRNDPLGVVLYSDGLSVTNGNGANTSFMALATYYFPSGYAFLPALVALLGASAMQVLASALAAAMTTPLRRVTVLSIWMACFLTLSQDFLAFQVLLPLAVLATLALWWGQYLLPQRFKIRMHHGRG